MSIRAYNKDHLQRLAEPLEEVPPLLRAPESDDPLRFWTVHEKPAFVDLTVFRDGETECARPGGMWAGAFEGRPMLIEELAPSIRSVLEYLSPSSVVNYFSALRAWWRLFSSVADVPAYELVVDVRVMTDISDLHRQRAFDSGMSRGLFNNFLRILNLARQSRKLAQLYWTTPEGRGGKRHMQPSWQFTRIRFGLKHAWFSTLRRWDTADELLSGRKPVSQEESRLLKNYRRFRVVAAREKLPRPSSEPLYGNVVKNAFIDRGYSVLDMIRGSYPDSHDIRAAFHLCLANTGWNAAVLLDLNVDEEPIEPHPKDPSRYLLRGEKYRGRHSEHVTEGLFKSKGSAGVIIQTLIKRTAPLREELRRNLTEAKQRYQALLANGATEAELTDCWKEVTSLESGVRSPWLYVTSSQTTVRWLQPGNYGRATASNGTGSSFLKEFIAELNKKEPSERQISFIKASDFRDAFAEYAYRVSGGMVLYVMKVLRHKQVRTTQEYLNNTVVNAESEGLYRTFSESLWDEIRIYRRVDPTILAARSRYGRVTDEQRQRLEDYRNLRRSRIGVGCKNPTNPPKHIAPDFEADGISMCPVQRCTLCLENGVIFPESLPGLAKRLAELRHIKSNISSTAFLESSFAEEMSNTEFALKHFDQNETEALIADWERRILSGEHRVIDLDGTQWRAA